MKYYSLTVKNNSGNLHSGERFCNSIKPLTIGQFESSDITIPCKEELLPQCLCTIVENPQGEGWLLIRKTDFYAVGVNGIEIPYICHLKDGDTISTIGHTFLFNTYDDDNYIEGQGLIRQAPRNIGLQWLIWSCSLLLVLAIAIGYPMLRQQMNQFTSNDEKALRSTIFKIVVSEIILQQHTSADARDSYRTISSYEPDSISIGTCFFTQDSLCITARHCVEPWVDYSGWSDHTSMTDLPQDVYWAVLAEKSQIEQADTLYRIVSRCQVLDGDSCLCEFTSDQCLFNRSRDIIARMGNERLPWRIIYPLYSRKDVELGDFAFVKTHRSGALDLATHSYLAQLDKDDAETGKRIYGYPKTNHGNLWGYQDISHISIPETQDGNFDQCLQLIVSGTSGYSGAPAIVKQNGKMTVVGIFSKIDDFVDSKNTFYAVPANEVSEYNATKANETKQYRR